MSASKTPKMKKALPFMLAPSRSLVKTKDESSPEECSSDAVDMPAKVNAHDCLPTVLSSSLSKTSGFFSKA